MKNQFFAHKKIGPGKVVSKSLRMYIYHNPNHKKTVWGNQLWLIRENIFKSCFWCEKAPFHVFSRFQFSSDHQTGSRWKQTKRRKLSRTKNPEPEVDPTFLPPTVTSQKWRKTEKLVNLQLQTWITQCVLIGSEYYLGGSEGIFRVTSSSKDNSLATAVQKLWHAKVPKNILIFFSATGNTMTGCTNRCRFHLCWRSTIPLPGRINS